VAREAPQVGLVQVVLAREAPERARAVAVVLLHHKLKAAAPWAKA
jgi:hypothetical protein